MSEQNRSECKIKVSPEQCEDVNVILSAQQQILHGLI